MNVEGVCYLQQVDRTREESSFQNTNDYPQSRELAEGMHESHS